MGTYSPDLNTFHNFLADGVARLGGRFAVGLDAVDAPLSSEDVQKRFQMTASAGVTEVDIWAYYHGSIKEPWWSLMKNFKGGALLSNASSVLP